MFAKSVIFAFLFLGVVKADWSPWSDYEPCRCDSRQSRTRECLTGDDCLGLVAEEISCACVPFDPLVQCTMIKSDLSLFGLAEDGCECANYYQCDFNVTTGEAYGIQRRCGACERWDNFILTCVIDSTIPDCIAISPTTEATGNCSLSKVEDNPAQFLLNNITIDCSPGTQWNQTQCTCVHVTPQFMLLGITCLRFDGEVVDSSHGIWADSKGVRVESDCGLAGSCVKFNATAESRISIPYFSNAMSQFSEFSVSLWFKRPASSGDQTLLTNSACSVTPSVEMLSSSGVASAMLKNESGTVVLVENIPATDDQWNHYVMVNNGMSVTVYMNGVIVSEESLFGKIANTKAPIVLGAALCENTYFDGYMDTISFAKGALNQDHVDFLYANPGICLP